MNTSAATPLLTVGQIAPPVGVRDESGNEVLLSSLWERRPLALYFTRHLG